VASSGLDLLSAASPCSPHRSVASSGLDLLSAASRCSPPQEWPLWHPQLAGTHLPPLFSPMASFSMKILDLMSEVTMDAPTDQVPTTASSGGRLWPGRTSTGRPQTPFSKAFTPWCSFCLQDDHPAQRCPQNPDQLWEFVKMSEVTMDAPTDQVPTTASSGGRLWPGRTSTGRPQTPFSKAFTPWCSFCLQDDHPAQRCPQNPDQLWVAWLPNSPAWQGGSAAPTQASVIRLALPQDVQALPQDVQALQ
jgi:hypothetical protein